MMHTYYRALMEMEYFLFHQFYRMKNKKRGKILTGFMRWLSFWRLFAICRTDLMQNLKSQAKDRYAVVLFTNVNVAVILVCIIIIKQCFFIMVQVDGEEALSPVDPNMPLEESQLPIVSADVGLLETVNQREIPFTLSTPVSSDVEKLALEPEDSGEGSAIVAQGTALNRKVLPLENPKEMIARWKIDKLDLKTVVKDALLSGRLPLAVLQLHLHRSTEFATEEEPNDTFTEVRDIGRAIAYDLFLKVAYCHSEQS